jgi:hypothetical protein
MYNGKVPEDSPRSEKRKYTSRLEQVLSEETFEQISEEAKTYIPKRNNITEAEAQFMFENIGLEESIVIVKSNPDWLLPEVRIALTNKVVKALEVEARKLREAGKVAEANVISASINGIVEIISAEGTKAGRFIQAFKLLDALSSDRTVSLINKKLKEAGKDPLTKEQEAELRRLKEESESFKEGYKSLLESIKSPFRQVLSNAGEVYQVVENVLLSVDDTVYGYDVRNKEYISTMSSKGIVDPFKVARVALESSVSIIGTLLTSNYSVINTKKEKV